MRFRTRLWVVAAFLATAPAAGAATITGPFTYDGHTYYLTSPDTWTNAQAEAVSIGGYLVVVNNAAENAFVLSTFGPIAGDRIWLGLTDAATEGAFSWVNGDPLTYTNWNPGEPNNDGNQDYGLMYQSGQWDDFYNVNLDMTLNIHGLVEIDSIEETAAVPEPATLALALTGLSGMFFDRRRRRSR